MQFYLDLFTPETWEGFKNHGSSVSGFRDRQRTSAERIRPGDIFVCYLVRLSRWCGLLEVKSELFTDSTPIFSDPDPFTLRFKVMPIVVLEVGHSLPIFEDHIWSRLSLTRDLNKRAFGWAQAANLRASLRALSKEDGEFLQSVLLKQDDSRKPYPLTLQENRKLLARTSVQAADRKVIVEVPVEEESDGAIEEASDRKSDPHVRESHRMQSAVARIGAEMGFRVWVPRGDKQAIIGQIPQGLHSTFLDALPLNYDDATLRTIEQIDVIWLKGRSMVRAFETEHTTAVYSGLLRMADLLALQPNMNIRLHIVAPADKREKVLREIRRPVFSLLDKGPLYESCTYLSYEAIDKLSRMEHLGHMTHDILEEFEEIADEE